MHSQTYCKILNIRPGLIEVCKQYLVGLYSLGLYTTGAYIWRDFSVGR